ncbi:MAG: DNA-processing protein DprA [Candidatus Bipolaricaulia bacterium]
MSESDLGTKRCWIGLNMISKMTPRRFQTLLDHFESPEAIWRAPSGALHNVPGFSDVVDAFVRERGEIDPDRELARIERLDLHILTLDDGGYPEPLRAIPNPPPVLYVQGDYLDRDGLSVSIVGTRRCSTYGRLITERLARELGKLGFTIVSGMALGIDTAAHRGALAAGARTIAVLGSGFAHIYPAENRELCQRIANAGCVLSEFSIGMRPDRWTFPQRNRIISGLSRGTIVVEAPATSGALITADLALDQGREVFAVPGEITRETSQGTHRLIKQGAKLIEGPEDVVEEFEDLARLLERSSARSGTEPSTISVSSEERQVLDALAFDPIHFNDIIEQTGLSPAQVSQLVLQLQMKELIVEVEGNRYTRMPR